jgi:hypothetical protein
VDHICVKHLRGSLRVVVAFEEPRRAWILLVGQHDDRDPLLNVYAELYRLLGVNRRRRQGVTSLRAVTRATTCRPFSALLSPSSSTAVKKRKTRRSA